MCIYIYIYICIYIQVYTYIYIYTIFRCPLFRGPLIVSLDILIWPYFYEYLLPKRAK